MKTFLLVAKNDYSYLKIKKENNKTIIIFETEITILDYICNKLNLDGIYDIDILEKYITDKNYYIFLEAFLNKDYINNYYDRMFMTPDERDFNDYMFEGYF